MARSRASQKIVRRTTADETFDDRIDLLRCRAALLTGKDKLLMQMYLDNSATFRQMARLAGVNEANVARRIHKLVRRLLDGQYITCLRNQASLTQEQIEIARSYFVMGLSMRTIADTHGVSYYAIRQTMKRIQRLVDVRQKPDKPVCED